MKLDMFKHAISLPGLALKYAFQNSTGQFYLFGPQFSTLYDLIRNHTVGGPSIIFHRYHERGKTKIKEHIYGDSAKMCESVCGLDANGLYLWCFSQEMPTGSFVVRQEPDFKVESPSKPFSTVSLQWIKHLEESLDRPIAHAQNGGEVKIGTRKIPVDGFDPATQTVYQFHGCFIHGHTACYDENKAHPYHPGKTFGDIHRKTEGISDYIRSCGYTLIEIWECDWKRHPNRPKSVENNKTNLTSESDILNAIKSNDLFGLVLVDIRTPDHLKERFAELPPIFKNTEVCREDIGDFMKAYAEKTGTLKHPTRMLISSYHAEKILLATPLLKYYLHQGLEVTKIHLIIEYTPDRCFSSVAEAVTDARRKGDSAPDYAVLAETMKLVGNSIYGKTAEDKRKHTNVHYTDSLGATRFTNHKLFKKMNRMTDEIFEVELGKKRILYDLPHHIAFFVYQYAKLRMLQLRYDFLDKFVDPSDFQMVEMDTDSCYMALATKDLESAIKPSMRDEFYRNFDDWFPALACDTHKQEFIDTKCRGNPWVQQPCCKASTKFHERTIGLFKTEFSGSGIIALCSKTYFCFGDQGNKMSCKGLQKKRNAFKAEQYLDVLHSQKNGSGINRGFRVLKDGCIYTYTQQRHGLSYLYCKRKVLSDGVSTIPLDI
jgi:hypothetical protein